MSENNEKWVDLVFENVKPGYYEISTNGKIRNKIKGVELKYWYDRYGYYVVTLQKPDNKSGHFYVHRLMAWTFVKGYDKEHNIVNHIDGIKTNNNIENLEWTTYSENNKHAYRIGLKTPARKLTNEQAKLICELLVKYQGNSKLVKDALQFTDLYFIDYKLIGAIKRKVRYASISDNYWKDGDFKIYHTLSDEDVKKICVSLVKNNMSSIMTFNELKNDIECLTYSRVINIKLKRTGKIISDEYF